MLTKITTPLADGWIETKISHMGHADTRVYRKAAGDLVLTLDGRAMDTTPGDLAKNLDDEWTWFLATRRRHDG